MTDKTLYAFDLDETLIHVGHKPLARNIVTNEIRELDSSLTEPLGENEVYDFSRFECIDTFRESVPVDFWSGVFNRVPPQCDIAIITARTSFIQPQLFKMIMIENGFDIINIMRSYLYFVGDQVSVNVYPNTPTAKAETIKNLINSNGYTKVVFLDDSQNNIDSVNNISLLSDYSHVKINTYLT